MITEYIQGEPGVDRELFGRIGALLLAVEVHQSLGVAPTAKAGDRWFVAERQDGGNAGFLQLRGQKNGKGHIRYVYSDEEKIQRRLIEAALETARAHGMESLYTHDRYTAGIWPAMGFSNGHKPVRGSFTRWSIAL